jgi:hypothetical protein
MPGLAALTMPFAVLAYAEATIGLDRCFDCDRHRKSIFPRISARPAEHEDTECAGIGTFLEYRSFLVPAGNHAHRAVENQGAIQRGDGRRARIGRAKIIGALPYPLRERRHRPHPARPRVADLVCHGHFDNLFANPADCRTRRRLFLASGYFLDGGELNTHKWVEALGAATGRSDLRSLTLSQFAGVSSFSWLRRRRAWCPRCLSIQAEADPDDIYEPLLWSIRLVSVCPADRPLRARINWLSPLIHARYHLVGSWTWDCSESSVDRLAEKLIRPPVQARLPCDDQANLGERKENDFASPRAYVWSAQSCSSHRGRGISFGIARRQLDVTSTPPEGLEQAGPISSVRIQSIVSLCGTHHKLRKAVEGEPRNRILIYGDEPTLARIESAVLPVTSGFWLLSRILLGTAESTELPKLALYGSGVHEAIKGLVQRRRLPLDVNFDQWIDR